MCIRDSSKGLIVNWWILEVATNVALIAIALWLGPFIKRFGRAYAADVFYDNPLTGKSYIVLTDVVYYLIFTAYILFTVRFAPTVDWANTFSERVTAEQLAFEVGRIGGILPVSYTHLDVYKRQARACASLRKATRLSIVGVPGVSMTRADGIPSVAIAAGAGTRTASTLSLIHI